MTCLIWDYQYPQIAFFKYQQQWTIESMPPSYTEMTPCYLPSQVEMPESAEPSNLEISKELQGIISEDKLLLQEQGSTSWAVFHSHHKSINQNPCRYFVDVTNMAR